MAIQAVGCPVYLLNNRTATALLVPPEGSLQEAVANRHLTTHGHWLGSCFLQQPPGHVNLDARLSHLQRG